ncbi:MAG: hypothetical protein ABIB47_04570 [Candidatus Woesearchaeota archaeon]
MAEIEVISEEPLTLVEAKIALEKIEKRDKELSERSKKTMEYVNKVAKKSLQDVKGLKKELEGVGRLKPKHIAKIIDVYPKDIDSLKVVISGENIALKQEDLQRILECLKK